METKGTLELIHSDVCGLIPSISLLMMWILCHIYWRLFKKDKDILLEEQEWSVWEIQEIQSLDREPFKKENQDTVIR